MAYQVLARKWRPRTFAELVGQQHVLRALINALDNQRLHHAYLFTGTRGVGKTTIARILAKSLNCETGVTSTPCGVCDTCREVDEGRFVDLIEVDAASRTRVEETRELLDNVQYTPTRGRYKVYLIDEVHMFSKSSFNALLKTLEEPPPHAKFLLATTDPQKLPATILSRCLQFNLKRLPLELIRDHLGAVLEREGIGFEAPALTLLARAADGSMRDGLSLLDQAIAFGGGKVPEEDVRAMLGTIAGDHVFGLLERLAAGDPAQVVAQVRQLDERSPDYAAWLDELLTALQRVALAQQVPDAIDDSLGDRERILGLARAMSPEDVQLYYQIGILGRRDLPLAPEPRGGFEMTVLRMLAFRPAQGEAQGGRALGPADQRRPSGQRPEHPAAPQPPAQPPAQSSAQSASRQPARPEPPRPQGEGGQRPSRGSPLDAARSLLGEGGGGGRRERGQTRPPRRAAAGDADGEADPEPHRPAQGAGPPVPPLGAQPAAQTTTGKGPGSAPLPPAAGQVPASDAAMAAEWIGMAESLDLQGGLRELAFHCALERAEGDTWHLVLDPRKAAGLLSKEREARLAQAVGARLGRAVSLSIRTAESGADTPARARQRRQAARQAQARQAIAEDALVNALVERFDARLHEDSIRPADG